MNLIVTISGTFADDLHEEEIESLREACEEEARYSGGHGVTVEVVRA